MTYKKYLKLVKKEAKRLNKLLTEDERKQLNQGGYSPRSFSYCLYGSIFSISVYPRIKFICGSHFIDNDRNKEINITDSRDLSRIKKLTNIKHISLLETKEYITLLEAYCADNPNDLSFLKYLQKKDRKLKFNIKKKVKQFRNL